MFPLSRPLLKSVYQEIDYLIFSTKTYVVGTRKHLDETVLLSTQNTYFNFKLMGKKIITILN